MTDSPENDESPSRGLLAVGAIIGGRYRIHELLGRGGMGVVYAASHELTQRKVALKVLDSGSSRELVSSRASRLPLATMYVSLFAFARFVYTLYLFGHELRPDA